MRTSEKRAARLWLVFWTLAALPLLLARAAYPFLPHSIPIHFDFSGRADRFGSRNQLFAICALILAWACIMALCSHGATHANRGREPRNTGINVLMLIGTLILLDGLVVWIFLYASDLAISVLTPTGMVTIFNTLLGILFIYCGNMLPLIRWNSWSGLKIPGTGTRYWSRLQRFGGRMLAASGILLLAMDLMPDDSPTHTFWMPVLMLSLCAALSAIYGHLISRERQ